jgi:2-succinyl-6-hydroxy-2,4-cyclohexadiene-1-carboxylate synthase
VSDRESVSNQIKKFDSTVEANTAASSKDSIWMNVSGAPYAESRLIFLHGFTQTGRSWDQVSNAIQAFRGPPMETVTVDLPGHGGSGRTSANLIETADLVANACGRGIYIGYSMGGRVALHLALQHPHLVQGLVLLGATGGIDDPHERQLRRENDEKLAATIETDGVDSFIAAWLAGALFQTLRVSPEDLAARKAQSASGLAMSLRRAGTGTQQPLWSDLAGVTVPTLLLAGSLDEKFAGLAQRLARSFGHARTFGPPQVELVPNAGHAAHLEQPLQTAEMIASFVASAAST